MSLVLFIIVVAVALVLIRRAVERRDHQLYTAITGGKRALQGIYRGAPAIASLEHLRARPVEKTPQSPYRSEAQHADGSDAVERRERARNALSCATWLLMSAVEDADDAERHAARGDAHGAEVARMRQNRAELEAMQCVFEAEDCLGVRIVREPGEQRCFARFYGQASQLQAVVSRFCDRAFGSRGSVPTSSVLQRSAG